MASRLYICYCLILLAILSIIFQLHFLINKLQHGHSEREIDETRHLHLRDVIHHSDPTLMIDDRTARAIAARPGGKLLCWIPSTPKNIHSKIAAVNSTWLKRCDGHVFFVEDLPPTLPRHEDIVSLDVPRGYYNLTAKVVAVMQYLYQNYLHDYDWFLKGDDDAYVIVENLRYILSRYNSSEAVYLGHLYKMFLKEGYMSGGATYVVSKESLRRLVEDGYRKNKCRTTGKYEDVEIGRCAHAVGIPSHNTRDKFSRDTFHPLKPVKHVKGPIPENQKPQDRFPMVAGPECCSQLSVSFHKVDPELMSIIDHLLYRTSVYGRVPDLSALSDLVSPSVVPPLQDDK